MTIDDDEVMGGHMLNYSCHRCSYHGRQKGVAHSTLALVGRLSWLYNSMAAFFSFLGHQSDYDDFYITISVTVMHSYTHSCMMLLAAGIQLLQYEKTGRTP